MRTKQLCQNLMEEIQQMIITLKSGLNDNTISLRRTIEIINMIEYKQEQLSNLIDTEREE